jgi:hypothetical protein
MLMKRYLNVHYGLVWTDLKDLQVPLRVGDVVILPGTNLFDIEGKKELMDSHWFLPWSR